MASINDIRSAGSTMELGGKVRTIKYDMNAYGELEERYGSVEKALELLQEGKMLAIRNTLWAGLIHEEVLLDEITGEPIRYTITPYQVGSWLNPSMLKEVILKITNVITGSLPPEAQKKLEEELTKMEQAKEDGPKIAKIVPTPEELKIKEIEEKKG